MKRIWILIAVVALFGCGLFLHAMKASAERGDEKAGGFGGFMHSEHRGMFGDLKPTKDQEEKLMRIKMDQEGKMLPLKLEVEKKRIELAELIIKPNPDRAAINGKLQEILSLEGQKQASMIDVYFQMSGVLNPDQKQAFSRMIVRKLMSHGFEGGISGGGGDRESGRDGCHH